MFLAAKSALTDSRTENLPVSTEPNLNEQNEGIDPAQHNENNTQASNLLGNTNSYTLELAMSEMYMFYSKIRILIKDKNLRKLSLKIPEQLIICSGGNLDHLIESIKKSSIEYLDLTGVNFTADALSILLIIFSKENTSKLMKVVFNIEKYPKDQQDKIKSLYQNFKTYAELNEIKKYLNVYLSNFYKDIMNLNHDELEKTLVFFEAWEGGSGSLCRLGSADFISACQYIMMFYCGLSLFHSSSSKTILQKYNSFFYLGGIYKLFEISAFYKLTNPTFDSPKNYLSRIFKEIIFNRIANNDEKLSLSKALEQGISDNSTPAASLIAFLFNHIENPSIEKSVVDVFKHLISQLVWTDDAEVSLLGIVFFDLKQVYSTFKKTFNECQTLVDLDEKVDNFLIKYQDRLKTDCKEIFEMLTSYKIVMSAALPNFTHGLQ